MRSARAAAALAGLLLAAVPAPAPAAGSPVDAARRERLTRALDLASLAAARDDRPGVRAARYAGRPAILVARDATLDDLRRAAPGAIRSARNGTWELTRTVFVTGRATLTLRAPAVRELRLAARPERFASLVALERGSIAVHGVRVRSWNPLARRPDADLDDGRPSVAVRGGGRLDAHGASFEDLGFYEGRVSGVAVAAPLGRGLHGTGTVRRSAFVRNFFGAYSYEARRMLWAGNRFVDNVVYGFDPHDRSNDFVVEDNIAAGNGRHGFIFSRLCDRNVLRRNRSERNGWHGFVIDDGKAGDGPSRDNVLEDNIARDNGLAGFSLDGAVGTLVRRNRAEGGRHGLRVMGPSDRNRLEANAVRGTTAAAVLLTAPSRGTVLEGNALSAGTVGVDVRGARDTRLRRNRIVVRRGSAVRVVGGARHPVGDTVLAHNRIAGSGAAAVIVRGVPAGAVRRHADEERWDHPLTRDLLGAGRVLGLGAWGVLAALALGGAALALPARLLARRRRRGVAAAPPPLPAWCEVGDPAPAPHVAATFTPVPERRRAPRAPASYSRPGRGGPRPERWAAGALAVLALAGAGSAIAGAGGREPSTALARLDAKARPAAAGPTSAGVLLGVRTIARDGHATHPTWYHDSQIVAAGGRLAVAWNGRGRTMLAELDAGDLRVLRRARVSRTALRGRADRTGTATTRHDVPALFADARGRLHAVYGGGSLASTGQAGPLHRATTAAGLGAWGPERRLQLGGGSAYDFEAVTDRAGVRHLVGQRARRTTGSLIDVRFGPDGSPLPARELVRGGFRADACVRGGVARGCLIFAIGRVVADPGGRRLHLVWGVSEASLSGRCATDAGFCDTGLSYARSDDGGATWSNATGAARTDVGRRPIDARDQRFRVIDGHVALFKAIAPGPGGPLVVYATGRGDRLDLHALRVGRRARPALIARHGEDGAAWRGALVLRRDPGGWTLWTPTGSRIFRFSSVDGRTWARSVVHRGVAWGLTGARPSIPGHHLLLWRGGRTRAGSAVRVALAPVDPRIATSRPTSRPTSRTDP